jgi:hypothetical protein
MTNQYTPENPNEGIVIVLKSTGKAVMETPGKFGKFEELDQILNHDKYRLMYVGDYLGKLNLQIRAQSAT